MQDPCILRLTIAYSDTVQTLSVALNPKDGRLNPKIVAESCGEPLPGA
jgi:hypothetical protein